MIPLKDTIRSRSFPLVTLLLIAANVLVFFYELSLSPRQLELLILHYGLEPASLDLVHPLTFLPFLTHMFLHSGWFHILSNLWILFIFGDNVEDRMGPGRYLVFYLMGGLAAATLQAVVAPGSTVPAIGASGAIAAVLGAYFLFYPTARVQTLIPIFIIPWFIEIPAIVYLGFWFVSQLFSGLAALATPSSMNMGGVAWFAHIGGFIFGLALGRLFAYRRPKDVWHADEYYPW
jgi:membrane associated rhomboid family serine protease